MAIDLYTDQPQQGLQEVAGQRLEQGKTAVGGIFSGTAGQSAFQSRMGRNQRRMDEAINAWGTDMVINWGKQSAQIRQALKDDMETMKIEMTQARQRNDMERYKLALQQKMFDEEMTVYADMLDKAKVGDIFTAIVGGLGQLGAGFFSSDAWYQMKVGWQSKPTFQTAGQYQATPFSGFTF